MADGPVEYTRESVPERVPEHLSRTLNYRESRRHFKRRVDAALADARLQRALIHGLTQKRLRRDESFEGLDFKAMQADLKRRREANVRELPELMERFRRNLESVGGTFHFARDDREACRIIGEICTRAGAGIVTKSKSMATEEILLNPFLESLGMEVVETDLGERMVQLDHSHPSHMIAPTIHMTKERAAELFGVEATVPAIQARARQTLREKFINASVGITGANAAIAETGTIMLVTNEGNAALVSTLPRVHIALFGIDKLVRDFEDAIAILRMLPRSGTGQRMTSYVDWITGPSRSADIEESLAIGVHGPGEMHCVVLDNGRNRMRDDPVFEEALHCIRCGMCSNVCPPFQAVGGHQFGHIYTGPIGLVLTPFHHGDMPDDWPNSLCCQCNACQVTCPVDIPLPRQILEHRRTARKPLRKRALMDAWAHPSLVETGMRLALPFRGRLPGAEALASRPFRDMAQSAAGSGEPAAIFASCMVDRMLPQAGVALERILRAAGFRTEFPKRQWCCGLVCANGGDFDRGAKLSRELADALAGTSGPIITPSTSCFGAFTIDAADWGVAGATYDEVAARMRDSTRFVLELLESRPELLSPADRARGRVAYHDSCQSLRQLGLRDEPRRVAQLAGYEVVELEEIGNCCGFGGTFSLDWPEVADRLLEWKLDAIARTGCTILASDNPGCLVHIANGARRRGIDLRVVHILELVAENLATYPSAT